MLGLTASYDMFLHQGISAGSVVGAYLAVYSADATWSHQHLLPRYPCAQVPRRFIGTDAFQETPIVEITRQITKHNFLVMDIKDLPRVIKEAFYLAKSGRPGKSLAGACWKGCDSLEDVVGWVLQAMSMNSPLG